MSTGGSGYRQEGRGYIQKGYGRYTTGVAIQKGGVVTQKGAWPPRKGACPGAGARGYLPRGLDALDEAEEDDDPGDAEAAQQGQAHLAQVPDVIREVEHVPPVPGGQQASAGPRHRRPPYLPVPSPQYLQYSLLGLVRFWVALRRWVRLTAAWLERFPSSTPTQSGVFQALLQYVQGSTRVMDTKK